MMSESQIIITNFEAWPSVPSTTDFHAVVKDMSRPSND